METLRNTGVAQKLVGSKEIKKSLGENRSESTDWESEAVTSHLCSSSKGHKDIFQLFCISVCTLVNG